MHRTLLMSLLAQNGAEVTGSAPRQTRAAVHVLMAGKAPFVATADVVQFVVDLALQLVNFSPSLPKKPSV